MVRKKTLLAVFLLFLLAFVIQNVSALCEEGQVDINTANTEELDQITHVGPAIAQRIIDARSFDSIDDLVRVSGISEGYVADIKAQGLACVENETSEEEKEDTVDDNGDSENGEREDSEDVKKSEIKLDISTSSAEDNKTTELQPISLNSPAKDIKSEENFEESEFGNKLAMYGFFVFSVIVGVLLIIRRKNTNKNDFE